LGLALGALLLCHSALGLEAPVTDPSTGLIQAPGYQLVQAHCGACHSLNLVTQNRGDEAHWLTLIRWMQAKHNLWDLGPAEAEILAYLGEHYSAPELAPRRAALATQWRDVE
jgi:mono/diheme cytochrome c family protein